MTRYFDDEDLDVEPQRAVAECGTGMACLGDLYSNWKVTS